MNDKDNQEFDKWFLEAYRYDYHKLVIPESVNPQKKAWQAACEYKQKEIDELLKQLKHEHDLYKKHLKVYEDENAKLRLVVDHYAQADDVGAYARIILRELKND